MARRKITEAAELAELAGEELPELTAQQQDFVRELLAGKTATDAYRAAYDCQNMQARTIWAEASRLRAHRNVAAWLSVARQAHLGHAIVTKEAHIRELERLKELALAAGNLGAAVQAEQLRGKAAGHYVEQYADVTPDDPRKTLHEIAELSPELAQQLAKEAGIAWPAEGTKH